MSNWKEKDEEHLLLKAFQEAFVELLKNKHPGSMSLYAFLKQKLYQFRLEEIYAESEILSEVFLRGRDSIEKGIPIVNLSAWIKATALNVIREARRERDKEKVSSEENAIEKLADNTPNALENNIAEERFYLIRKALTELSEEDQQLLILKFFDGLSWSQIALALKTNLKEATLRKRGERALLRLRSIYSQMEENRYSRNLDILSKDKSSLQ